MNFANPLKSIFGNARASILETLAKANSELTQTAIAEISHVSTGQVSAVMPDLVALGIVDCKEVPPALLFKLADDNHAANTIKELVNVSESVVGKTREFLRKSKPQFISAAIFGSFANGTAITESDIDVVVITNNEPEDCEQDIEDLRDQLFSFTGNEVNILTYNLKKAKQFKKQNGALRDAILRSNINIFGQPIEDVI